MLRESHRPGIEPATCKSQVQRPAAEPPHHVCASLTVADRVVVTSKHNDDEQHIWESDAASFSVVKDPRGNTLGRGTTVSLHLKEEAHENLEPHRIRDLVKKYSQFINFPIYLWESKVYFNCVLA